MQTKPCLTSEDAHRMMAACKEEAFKNNWNVTIAIVDAGGYLLMLERLDGASLPSIAIAQGKAKTSALSRMPTKALEDTIKERPALLTFPDRTPVQGGVPLIYQGECVGAIGVSGVKSAEDEQIALAGSKTLG